MHVHLVAVAGTGMGALAGLLVELGHRVTGSDVRFDPPIGPALTEWGVELREGFDPAHLTPAPDLVVVGNVCKPNNLEARAAIDGGLPFTHIAGALRRFVLDGTAPLVVAGTHGKTTTTALAAYLLEAGGRTPGFLVGGVPIDLGRSFRAPPKGPVRLPSLDGPRRRTPFVIEGDEYDTAFFEKTAKFLHYAPEVAILGNVEHDHIDIYPTEQAYLDAFRAFVALLPEDGLLVANAADARVRELAQECRAHVSWTALHGDDTGGIAPHWLAAPANADARGLAFDLHLGGMKSRRMVSPLPGLHNLRNAIAALAAVTEGYGARFEALPPALAAFRGVKRRQELLGTPDGVALYDDFAHHPTAVAETLPALKQRTPNGRLFVVFEPRSATACRRIHQAAYEGAFDAADVVWLAPIGRPDLPLEERLDLSALTAALRARGKTALELGTSGTPWTDELLARATAELRAGDALALLSNGPLGGMHPRLLAALTERAASRG